MRKLACAVLVVLAALVVLFPAGLARAAETERILSFDSIVTVARNSTLTVEERITVVSAGIDIQHGIYRDFPTTYTDPESGRTTRVAFRVQGVTRDGATEPWHTGKLSNGVSVYIGSASVDLPPGVHTYVLTYTTDRQVGYFEGHDELYWNVTGNGWAFPIDVATCTVILPGETWRQITGMTAYTGPQGALGSAFTIDRDNTGNPVFRTTASLGREEGLSVVVAWPPGIVARPTRFQRFIYWLRDNRSIGIAAGALIALLLYFAVVWICFGRDPKRGTIIPQFSPPEGMSPAAVRYLRQMQSDSKSFAAAITGLAVKGGLIITQAEDGTYSVDTTGTTPQGLTPDETAVLEELFTGRKRTKLTFKQGNPGRVLAVRKALEDALRGGYGRGFFVTNGGLTVIGIVLSILGVIAAGLLGDGAPERIFGFLFIGVWLTIWTFGVLALLGSIRSAWASPTGSAGRRGAVFTTLFAIPFVIGEIVGIAVFIAMAGVLLLGLSITTAVIDYVFFHLMRAYTPQGRAIMDQIDGFRLYLGVAEKNRIEMATSPDHTPDTYERYLPYAMALDVEREWTDAFADVLRVPDAEGMQSVHPAWFVANSPAPVDFASLGTSLSNSLASAAVSASSAPGHSSGFGGGGGGGGGGSGGGGGGGGGGGW